MEELPRCREKIKSLEQKNENLQAIIDLKADYEKYANISSLLDFLYSIVIHYSLNK